MPLLPKAEGRSAPNIQSRPAVRTQKEQKMKQEFPLYRMRHYALYVRAPKSIMAHSV